VVLAGCRTLFRHRLPTHPLFNPLHQTLLLLPVTAHLPPAHRCACCTTGQVGA
jgi:hypothetical protein